MSRYLVRIQPLNEQPVTLNRLTDTLLLTFAPSLFSDELTGKIHGHSVEHDRIEYILAKRHQKSNNTA